MHVYIMCALCVCEMHAHACALHLCIALLCAHLSAWDCSQAVMVKTPWADEKTKQAPAKQKHALQ